MGILGGLSRPAGDLAQKASKAAKIKSVKVKVSAKFDPKAKPGAVKPDAKD